jgi:hypothetical protein
MPFSLNPGPLPLSYSLVITFYPYTPPCTDHLRGGQHRHPAPGGRRPQEGPHLGPAGAAGAAAVGVGAAAAHRCGRHQQRQGDRRAARGAGGARGHVAQAGPPVEGKRWREQETQ